MRRIGPSIAGPLFPALCSRNQKRRSQWRRESTGDCFRWKKDWDPIWNASTRYLCSAGSAFSEFGICLLSPHHPLLSSLIASDSASPASYAVRLLVGFWQISCASVIDWAFLSRQLAQIYLGLCQSKLFPSNIEYLPKNINFLLVVP